MVLYKLVRNKKVVDNELERYLTELWELKEKEILALQNALISQPSAGKATKKNRNNKSNAINKPNHITNLKPQSLGEEKLDETATDAKFPVVLDDYTKQRTFKPSKAPSMPSPIVPTATPLKSSLKSPPNEQASAGLLTEKHGKRNKTGSDASNQWTHASSVPSQITDELNASPDVSPWVAKVKRMPMAPLNHPPDPIPISVEVKVLEKESANQGDKVLPSSAREQIYENYPLCYELDIKPENICGKSLFS